MPKPIFISFDGIDGSGKGYAVSALVEKLRADGLKVWAGAPREEVGSCRLQANNPEGIPAYIKAGLAFKERLRSEGYDAVIWDRSAPTLVAWFGFQKQFFSLEKLHEMLSELYCDLNIVLKPDLTICQHRASRRSGGSHMAKTPEYWASFWKTMDQTIEFLSPRLGNRFVVFEDNEKAVEWAYQTAQRLRTHIDLHLTNACPLSCPTCCFDAGENHQVDEAARGKLEQIVEAGMAAGINEFHLLGGEPLLLGQDLIKIMKMIKEKGGKTHLLTSGYSTELSKDVLPLADAVFISLDGSAETHNFTRGKSIFDETCRFISMASEYGCKVRIGTVVSRLNIKTAPQVVDIVDRMGVTPSSLCFMNMSPTGSVFSGGNAERSLQHYLMPEEWIEFCESLTADQEINSKPWVKVEPAFSNRPELFGCELMQGKRRVVVMANGDMYPCFMLTTGNPYANILSQNPADAIMQVLRSERLFKDSCKNGCWGGCPGYAEVFGGNGCDARCGNTKSRLPAQFRLSAARMRNGWRPICPCRTAKISSL